MFVESLFSLFGSGDYFCLPGGQHYKWSGLASHPHLCNLATGDHTPLSKKRVCFGDCVCEKCGISEL